MPKSCCSMKRSVVAGAIGGIVAVAVIAILGALLLRRVGPRMMSEGGCSEAMRACMEKCGCGRPENADGADRS
jgi:hypothetical protein